MLITLKKNVNQKCMHWEVTLVSVPIYFLSQMSSLQSRWSFQNFSICLNMHIAVHMYRIFFFLKNYMYSSASCSFSHAIMHGKYHYSLIQYGHWDPMSQAQVGGWAGHSRDRGDRCLLSIFHSPAGLECRMNTSLLTTSFSLVRPMSNFWTTKLKGNPFVLS